MLRHWAVRADAQGMSTRRLGRRAAAVAVCAGLLATANPAEAAEPAPASRNVVLTLRGAAAHSTAAHDRVARYLAKHGFTVTGGDAWTVSAHGSATARLKSDLGGDVAQVAGLGTQHQWHHRAIPGGHTSSTLRSAYDVVRAGSDGNGLTIATVQFSGWDSSDLSTYAAAAGVAMPSVTQVSVNGFSPTNTSNGGDYEVALDQEVLLAAAPKAAQRIYFAANTTVEAVALYSRIATDAEAGLVDVVSTSWGMCEPWADDDAGSRASMESALARIVAAGATVFAASGDLGAYDCSSEEAPDSRVTVDFPAVSPSVVGVGGTRLTGTTGAWTETVWSEPAAGEFKGYAGGGGQSSSVPRPSWQAALPQSGTKRLVPDIAAMADPGAGFGFYAGSLGGWLLGGGTSAAAPLVAGHLAATLSSAGRTTGVGDLHDEIYANPAAFRDVTVGSNLVYNAVAGYDLASGMGSPRWSALAAILFGDPLVTTAAASRTATVPVDVTPVPGMVVQSWSAGEGTTVACAPGGPTTPPASVTLGAGNDRNTHVAVAALDANNVCHVGTAPVLLDSHAPAAFATISSVTGADGRTKFSWGATDAAPSSGLAAYDVCVYAVGYGCAWSSHTTGRTVTLSLVPGRTYQVRISSTDRAGNRGTSILTGTYVVPYDSRSFAKTPGGWTAQASRYDWFGSTLVAAKAGAAATRLLTGTKYEVFYVAQPSGGSFDVYVGGHFARHVNTYASTRQYRRVALGWAYTSRKARTVTIVARTKGVTFDAVRVAY
jgi:hypothetical protein